MLSGNSSRIHANGSADEPVPAVVDELHVLRGGGHIRQLAGDPGLVDRVLEHRCERVLSGSAIVSLASSSAAR